MAFCPAFVSVFLLESSCKSNSLTHLEVKIDQGQPFDMFACRCMFAGILKNNEGN